MTLRDRAILAVDLLLDCVTVLLKQGGCLDISFHASHRIFLISLYQAVVLCQLNLQTYCHDIKPLVPVVMNNFFVTSGKGRSKQHLSFSYGSITK